jgi:hypothetical protein
MEKQYLPQTTRVTAYRDIRTKVRSPMRRTIDPKDYTSTERHVTFQITPHENLPPVHDPMFKILPHRPQTVNQQLLSNVSKNSCKTMVDYGKSLPVLKAPSMP